MIENKLVYIASPYSGDVKANITFTKAACNYAIKQGVVPIAVHLLYPQILNDSIPEEREVGIQMGLRVLKACDELWLCGDRISAGMQTEKEAAEQMDVPVHYIPKQEIGVERACSAMRMCQC